jgi:hypothetical protein
MKKRVSRIVNFFAFNLLFFALYLNFIHKDKASITEQPAQAKQADVTRTVLVENPSKYLGQGTVTNVLTNEQDLGSKTEQKQNSTELKVN